LSCTCKHQESKGYGDTILKEINLDSVKTIPLQDFLVIPISKKFLIANNGKQIVFEAKLTLDGKLQLCAELSKLTQSYKEVINCES